MNLDVAQNPTFIFSDDLFVGKRQEGKMKLYVDCNASRNGTSLTCLVPPLPASLNFGEVVPYDIIMDAAPGPNVSLVPELQLTLSPNPNPSMLRVSDQVYTPNSNELISIEVSNVYTEVVMIACVYVCGICVYSGTPL